MLLVDSAIPLWGLGLSASRHGGKQVRVLAGHGFEGGGEAFSLGGCRTLLPSNLAPPMTAIDLICLIETDGWARVGIRGSHRQYAHPDKPGVLTLRRHRTEEIAAGALHGVLRQAGLEP